jgi:rhodanese-related sulfurtransferase
MKQHAPRFLSLVREAKQQIKEISPQELKKALESQQALYLIDVREDHELSSGHIPSAIHLSKGVIERDIEKIIPNPDEPIVVYCSGGFRCALVAQSLKAMGYTQVSSLETGSQGWVDAGYPLEK